jgi:hypothetical protein
VLIHNKCISHLENRRLRFNLELRWTDVVLSGAKAFPESQNKWGQKCTSPRHVEYQSTHEIILQPSYRLTLARFHDAKCSSSLDLLLQILSDGVGLFFLYNQRLIRIVDLKWSTNMIHSFIISPNLYIINEEDGSSILKVIDDHLIGFPDFNILIINLYRAKLAITPFTIMQRHTLYQTDTIFP